MSPPSSGDDSASDDAAPTARRDGDASRTDRTRAPTRRGVLTALATSVPLTTAGCLGVGGRAGRADAADEDASLASDPTGTSGATPEDRLSLTATSHASAAHDLRVRVAGDATHDESFTVDAGLTEAVTRVATSGTYTVVVEDRTADRTARSGWAVRGALRDLRIVVTDDALRFVQTATCTPACEEVSTGGESTDLPYHREGGTETFRAGSIEIRYEYEALDAVLSLSLHDGETTVLDYDYRLDDRWELSLPAVVGTEGWYRVDATVGEETTAYDWHVAGNYPHLTVSVDERGVPRIGCGTDPEPLVLVNERAEEVTVDLRLHKRGETVWEGPVSLGADSNLRLTPVALGDDRTVEARVGDAVATGEYVTCDCRGGETTVTVDETVSVESHVGVCE
jgi:hypothetical protein